MSAIARRYYVRGVEALRRGEVDGARDELRAALEIAPYYVEARIAYAGVLARGGEAPRGAALLREGVTTEQRPGRPPSPALVRLHRSLGEVLIAAGDYRGAEHAFTQAAELGQQIGLPQRDLADRLARLRAKTGRFAEALEQLLLAARP